MHLLSRCATSSNRTCSILGPPLSSTADLRRALTTDSVAATSPQIVWPEGSGSTSDVQVDCP